MFTATDMHDRKSVLVVWLVIVSIVVTLLPAGAARAAEPAKEGDPILDLPAMALAPADLTQAGYSGFGIGNVGGDMSAWRTIGDAVAESVATNDIDFPANFDELNFELSQLGWKRQFRQVLGLPTEFDATLTDTSVVSEVAEYADEDGADAALTLLMGAGEAVPPTAAPIGDRLEIRRFYSTINLEPRLQIAFRDRNLLGFVTITNFLTEEEPDVDQALLLARAMQVRIESVIATLSPGISAQALKLASLASPAYLEGYRRLGGEMHAEWGDTEEDLAERAEVWGESSDVYQFEQYILPRAGQLVGPLYKDRIYRFFDAAAASDHMAGLPAGLAEDTANSNGEFEADLVADVPEIGDESLVFQIRDLRREMPVYGYRIYVRVGASLARVEMNGSDSPSIQMVEELATLQAACLAATSCAEAGVTPPMLGGIDCPPTNLALEFGFSPAPLGEGSIPMAGVDEGRTGFQPGPRPAGTLNQTWSLNLHGTVGKAPTIGEGLISVLVTGTVHSLVEEVDDDAGYLYMFDTNGNYQWCLATGNVTSDHVISNGQLFVETRAHEGAQFQSALAALDPKTGEVQWTACIGLAFNDFSGSILAADRTVYATAGLGTLYAFDQATGSPRWMFDVGPNSGIDWQEQRLSRAAYADGLIFITAGHTLHALDANTGEVVWQLFVDDAVEDLGDPVVSNGVVLAGGTHAVYGVDAQSGEQLWQFAIDSQGGSRLAADDDVLYVSTGSTEDKSGSAFIAALDAATGSLLWQNDAEGYVTAAAVGGDILYVGTKLPKTEAIDTGMLAAIDPTTGASLWSQAIYGTLTTPAVVDGRLFIGGNMASDTGVDGSIHVFSGSETPVEILASQ